MLKQELLEELREIIREDFNENLNDKELFKVENNLLSYFKLLAKVHVKGRLEDEKRI
jgi:hypothetical protein